MYLVGDSFCVSFKWVVIISTKQEAAHTLWGLVTNYGEGGYKTAVGGK